MDKITQDAMEIAEKICQRKFEEHFDTKLGEKKVYIEKSQMDIYREQMKMWDELGKTHLKKKQSITIRVAEQDIETIKIKASKLGLPYQTYINMLIHKEATKL